MSKINIRRNHELSRDELRGQAETLVQSLSRRYGLDYEWRDDELHFYRAGVKGCVVLEDKALEVNAKLGMMLAPLKSPITDEITRKLDQFLKA